MSEANDWIEEGRSILTAKAELEFLDQMECALLGVRVALCLKSGKIAWAEEPLRRLGARIGDLIGAGTNVQLETVDLNRLRAWMSIASDDIQRLEDVFDDAIDDPLYDTLEPWALAHLRIQFAIGWNELERRDPGAERRAAAEALIALPDATFAQPRIARLLLAEIALREGDPSKAKQWLSEVAAEFASFGQPTDCPQFVRWATLRARLALKVEDQLDEAWGTIEDGFQAFRSRWADLERLEGGRGILQYKGAQDLLGERIRLAVALEGEAAGARRAFEDIATVHRLGTLCEDLDCSEAGIDELVSTSLRGDERHALLLFLAGPERSFAAAATPSRWELFELAQADHINAARRRAVACLEAPRRGIEQRREQRMALEEFRDILLPERLQRRLTEWDAVTVLGLETFGIVPFEALPLEMADGESSSALGVQLAVDVLPVLPWAGSFSPLSSEFSALHVVTNPESGLGPGPSPVHFDEAGLADLSRGWGAGPTHVETGSSATLEPWISRTSDSTGMLAILAHGVVDPSRPSPRGIALSPSSTSTTGLLFADGVRDLAACPPLVVIGACRAGRAVDVKGDPGAADLVGAFVSKGAVAVACSDFDLEPEAARRLVREYARELTAGAAPAEALRRARADLASDERFDDPYYYATMRLYGRGQQPVFEGSPTKARWKAPFAALGLAVALAAAALIWRRGG